MLTLPIKRKWFDMICKGQKREEYREPSEYWRVRFNKAMNITDAAGRCSKYFPYRYAPDIGQTARPHYCGCIASTGKAVHGSGVQTLERIILSCRYCTLRKLTTGNGETKSEI